MVELQIRDEVWQLYTKASIAQGINTHQKMIEILESMIEGDSIDILNSAQEEPITNGRKFLMLAPNENEIQELINSKAYKRQRTLEDFL